MSTEENAEVQQQILELMLQASISQLKSMDAQPKDKGNSPVKPAPLLIPKPAIPAAAKPKPKPKSEPSWDTRRSKLQAIKPQVPNSDAHTLLFNTAKIYAFYVKFRGGPSCSATFQPV